MFGKTTEYAIRALVYAYLQNSDGIRPGFKEIANHILAPKEFTGKVMQSLVKSHLLLSVKGPGGGFYFKDMESPISLDEVVKVFEGDKFFYKCGFGLKECSDINPCPLHNDYSPVREKLRKIVSDTTIQILASRIKNNQAVLNAR